MNSEAQVKARALALAVAAAVLLVGCAASPMKQEAPAECPAPAPVVLPVRPTLVIKTLPAEASCHVVLQAYVASLNQCIGYADELRLLHKATPDAKPES